MADPKTPSTGDPDTPSSLSGFPDDPAAPPAGDLAAPTPSAGAEPEAQIASMTATDLASGATASGATASGGAGASSPSSSTSPSSAFASSDESLLPPPASYEMPDEYATSWLDKTRAWVEANPALAVVAAAGIGLVVGRLAMGLLPEPEPPTLVERVERRAKRLKKDAKRQVKDARRSAAGLAGDAGDALQHQLAKAAEALSDAAEAAAEKVGGGVEKTTDFAEAIGDAVKAAVVGAVNRGSDSWVGKLRR